MKTHVSLFVLLLVAAMPVAPTLACGGKIEQGDPVSNPNDSATSTATTTPPASTLTACPADSAPIHVPANIDAQILATCTASCNHAFDCAGCTWASCVPSCIGDALDEPCGALSQKSNACNGQLDSRMCSGTAECAAAYCDYLKCADPTSPCP
jgi:hypothetical protein